MTGTVCTTVSTRVTVFVTVTVSTRGAMRSVSVRNTVTVSTRGATTSPCDSLLTGIRRCERGLVLVLSCAEAADASRAKNAAPATSNKALRFNMGLLPLHRPRLAPADGYRARISAYCIVTALHLSLIHISEPTRQAEISYA